MSTTTVDEKTLEVLRREESKIVRALEIYYDLYARGLPVTLNYAANKSRVSIPVVVDFIGNHKTLGMPETREESLAYLKELRCLYR